MKALLGNLLKYINPRSDLARETVWNDFTQQAQRAVEDRQYDKVEGRLDSALNWLNGLPEDEPRLHLRLSELADLYQSLAGSNSKAEELYGRSVRAAEKNYGKDSVEVAIPLNSLAILLIQQRRHDEAEQHLNRLLPIVEDAFGPDHREVASCLENLSAVLRQTNRAGEAAQLRSRAMKIRRAAHG